MTIYANVIADSIHPDKNYRLTTIELEMPRFILAELNTHRAFCLSGDTKIWFRQPNGTVRKELLADLFDKWENGATSRPSKKGKDWPIERLIPNKEYSMREAANLLGMASSSNLNQYCREGRITQAKKRGRAWVALGRAINKSLAPTANRQPLKDRLKGLALDQIDENSLDLGLTTLNNVMYSGVKEVFRMTSGTHSIKASADHRFFTPDGWKRVKELRAGDKVAVVLRGKPEGSRYGGRFKTVNGKWVNQWIRSIKDQLPVDCNCGLPAVEAHHKIPVHVDPGLAFDLNNIAHLCVKCHNDAHRHQGWQQGVPNYVDYQVIDSIEFVGEEPTFDIEVTGVFPNFIADGFVVHNSRNSASSRAIPVKKQIERIINDPVLPAKYQYNQSGMQASQDMTEADKQKAESIILELSRQAAQAVEELNNIGSLGLHKQWANRYLEPWMWHKVIITSMEWKNFFHQRSSKFSPLAQPEMQMAADCILEAMENSQVKQSLTYGQWHTPYIQEQDIEWAKANFAPEVVEKALIAISVARCARVSYLTHNGVRDQKEDLNLYRRLITANPPHFSPMEHVATPYDRKETPDLSPKGNFIEFAGTVRYDYGFFPHGFAQLRHNPIGDNINGIA